MFELSTRQCTKISMLMQMVVVFSTADAILASILCIKTQCAASNITPSEITVQISLQRICCWIRLFVAAMILVFFITLLQCIIHWIVWSNFDNVLMDTDIYLKKMRSIAWNYAAYKNKMRNTSVWSFGNVIF